MPPALIAAEMLGNVVSLCAPVARILFALEIPEQRPEEAQSSPTAMRAAVGLSGTVSHRNRQPAGCK